MSAGIFTQAEAAFPLTISGMLLESPCKYVALTWALCPHLSVLISLGFP